MFTSSFVYGQKFAPIGAEWYFSEPNAGYASDYDYNYQKYTCVKDTLVNGKTCRLITNRYYPSEILYEENGSVYYYYLNGFRKIFDFSVNKGDTVDFEFKCITNIFSDSTVILLCVVDSITAETIDGQLIKTFHTVILEEELFGLPIIRPSKHYTYTELFGMTHIRYDEFIPVCNSIT